MSADVSQTLDRNDAPQGDITHSWIPNVGLHKAMGYAGTRGHPAELSYHHELDHFVPLMPPPPHNDGYTSEIHIRLK